MTATATTTRADLLTRLADCNARCKAISRRGRVGTLSEDYEWEHAALDLLVRELLTL